MEVVIANLHIANIYINMRLSTLALCLNSQYPTATTVTDEEDDEL